MFSEVSECTYRHCVPTNQIVIFPSLPPALSLKNLAIFYPVFRDALSTKLVTISSGANVTLVTFSSKVQGMYELSAVQRYALFYNSVKI